MATASILTGARIVANGRVIDEKASRIVCACIVANSYILEHAAGIETTGGSATTRTIPDGTICQMTAQIIGCLIFILPRLLPDGHVCQTGADRRALCLWICVCDSAGSTTDDGVRILFRASIGGVAIVSTVAPGRGVVGSSIGTRTKSGSGGVGGRDARAGARGQLARGRRSGFGAAVGADVDRVGGAVVGAVVGALVSSRTGVVLRDGAVERNISVELGPSVLSMKPDVGDGDIMPVGCLCVGRVRVMLPCLESFL